MRSTHDCSPRFFGHTRAQTMGMLVARVGLQQMTVPTLALPWGPGHPSPTLHESAAHRNVVIDSTRQPCRHALGARRQGAPGIASLHSHLELTGACWTD